MSTTDESTTLPEASEDTTPALIAPEGKEADQNPNSEAAKWRVKLRKVEAERDELAARLSASRQGIIDDYAQRLGVVPAAFKAAGHDVDSFFTQEGQLMSDALKEAITTTKREFGIGKPGPIPSQGTGDPNTGTGTSWSSVIRGR